MTTLVVANRKNETAIASEALRGPGEVCRLPLYGTLQKLHAALNENYFLTPRKDKSDPDRLPQITAVTAHPNGIHGVYSYRGVFSCAKFRGIGSGHNFAPGAMFASAERARSAQSAAKIGARAGCESDKRSVLPLRVSGFPMVIATEIQKADA